MAFTNQLFFFFGFLFFVTSQNIGVEWAINAGGVLEDSGRAVSLDTVGNIYFTGTFLPPGVFGPDIISGPTGASAFISKVNNTAHWIWTRSVNNSDPRAITNDNTDSVYVAGVFQNTANFGPFSLTASSNGNLFVAKLSSDGTWLWATTNSIFIDNCTTEATGIVVNGTKVYITGSTTGTCSYGADIIDTTYKSPLIALLNTTNGGWIDEIIVDVEEGEGEFTDLTIIDNFLEPGYAIYVVGVYKGNVSFGSQTFVTNPIDKFDILVAKMNLNFTWGWARSAGGPENDFGLSIVGKTPNIYIGGAFSGTAQFGIYPLVSTSITDMFISSLDISGNWQYAVTNLKTGGLGGSQIIRDMVLIDENRVYVTGTLKGSFTFGNNMPTVSYASPFVAIQTYGGFWIDIIVFPSDFDSSDSSGSGLAYDENRNIIYNIGKITLDVASSDAYLTKLNFVDFLPGPNGSNGPTESPTTAPSPFLKAFLVIVIILSIIIVLLIILFVVLKYNKGHKHNKKDKHNKKWNVEMS